MSGKQKPKIPILRSVSGVDPKRATGVDYAKRTKASGISTREPNWNISWNELKRAPEPPVAHVPMTIPEQQHDTKPAVPLTLTPPSASLLRFPSFASLTGTNARQQQQQEDKNNTLEILVLPNHENKERESGEKNAKESIKDPKPTISHQDDMSDVRNRPFMWACPHGCGAQWNIDPSDMNCRIFR